MNRGIISTRYAKALLSYALEEGVEDKVYTQIKQLFKSFNEVPELAKSLVSPIFSHENKASMIRTASGGTVSNEFDRFINLVLTNKREHLLCSIALMYTVLYQKSKNISICSLVTAVPISDEVEERIKRLITGKTHGSVELEKSTNPDILGGFVFELNYNRLDASVATQLKRIQTQFLAINNK
ncbi:MAG: F0F1 ATP synthase subunit delta [Bacteroidales bacterium]